jgi:hypothetical protein
MLLNDWLSSFAGLLHQKSGGRHVSPASGVRGSATGDDRD